MITLDLFGTPVPQARPKFFRRNDHVGSYDPQKNLRDGFRWQIKGQYRNDPLLCPLRLDLIFFMPIPASKSKLKKKQMANGLIAHACKPDLDNLVKFICDAMEGIIFKNDSQIVEMHLKKIYSEKPGTFARILPLADTKESLLYENCARDIGQRNLS